MECLFGSDRSFLRSHFYKAEAQGFPSVTSDHSGGYHVPMWSEDVVELLIRTGLWKTLNEQSLCHSSSTLSLCGNNYRQPRPGRYSFALDMGSMSLRILQIMKRRLLPRVGFPARR